MDNWEALTLTINYNKLRSIFVRAYYPYESYWLQLGRFMSPICKFVMRRFLDLTFSTGKTPKDDALSRKKLQQIALIYTQNGRRRRPCSANATSRKFLSTNFEQFEAQTRVWNLHFCKFAKHVLKKIVTFKMLFNSFSKGQKWFFHRNSIPRKILARSPQSPSYRYHT